MITEISWPHLNKVLSLAKLQISDFTIKSNRLLLKTLKRRGPNIKPWGTTLTTSGGRLNGELRWVRVTVYDVIFRELRFLDSHTT